MIVIPRKKGESVVINDDIILTVIEIKGDKVRLGVEHLKEVAVHKREVSVPPLTRSGPYRRTSSHAVADASELVRLEREVELGDAWNMRLHFTPSFFRLRRPSEP